MCFFGGIVRILTNNFNAQFKEATIFVNLNIKERIEHSVFIFNRLRPLLLFLQSYERKIFTGSIPWTQLGILLVLYIAESKKGTPNKHKLILC